MKTVAIERKVRIAATPQTVWRAITEPEHLKQWYAPGCPWEIPALQVGSTVRFYNTDTDIQLATIEVIEPLHQFSLRWQLDPQTPEMTLINTFLLEAENGSTHVTVTQSGYEMLPDNMRQQTLDQDQEAYTAIVEGLKAYVERANL